MKFNFATIHVKDLETSIRFYEEVIGMKMVRRFPAGPNMEIAFMAGAPEDEPGSAEIELICDKGAEPAAYGEYPSLGLAVDNLDAALAHVQEKGVEIAAGPMQPNPNTRFFFIHDPDGVNLEIIEQK